ncbi:hypothetical protein Fcan01_20079 [Folsomia candida]|uniref:Uncharacterized protein n=1 Tax=Folsomia candida TaxID=158441 RepID=A0A226DIR0_FOLCA|nr:hypothetical protein Fcan01_20079 [Folsomia candida]
MQNSTRLSDYYNKVQLHLDHAIQMDPDVVTGAHLLSGDLLLVGKLGVVLGDKWDANYKTKAISKYRKCLELIQSEVDILQLSIGLLSYDTTVEHGYLKQQILDRLHILESIQTHVYGTIQTVTKSLRPIDIKYINQTSGKEVFLKYLCDSEKFSFSDNVNESSYKNLNTLVGKSKSVFTTKADHMFAEITNFFQLPKSEVDVLLPKRKTFLSTSQKLSSKSSSNSDFFTLTFNGLTAHKDCGERDQCLQTMEALKDENFHNIPTLMCKDLDWKQLVKILSKNEAKTGVTQSELITTLTNLTKNHPVRKKIIAICKSGQDEDVEKMDSNEFITCNEATEFASTCDPDTTFNIIIKNRNITNFNIFTPIDMDIQLDHVDSPIIPQILESFRPTLFASATIILTGSDLSLVENQFIKFPRHFSQQTAGEIPTWFANPGEQSTQNYDEMRIIIPSEAVYNTVLNQIPPGITVSIKFSHLQSNFLPISTHSSPVSPYTKTHISLNQVTKSKLKQILPILRNLDVSLALTFQNLSLHEAQYVIASAQIRQENMQQNKLQTIENLFTHAKLPLETVHDYRNRGIYLLHTFTEKKFIPWRSIFAVCGIATAQMLLGAVLIYTGFGATVGMGLITEGIADFITAYRTYRSREFTWSQYRSQKVISIAISVVSGGLSYLKNAAKGATIVESAATEVAEQIATSGVSKVTTAKVGVGATQIFQDIGRVAVHEMGREGLHMTVNAGSDLALRALEGTIREKLERTMTQQIQDNSPLLRMLAYYHALDCITGQNILEKYIRNILDVLMSPSNNEMDQVYANLSNSFLSSMPQGGKILDLYRLKTIASGSLELVKIVPQLCHEMQNFLEPSVNRTWSIQFTWLCRKWKLSCNEEVLVGKCIDKKLQFGIIQPTLDEKLLQEEMPSHAEIIKRDLQKFQEEVNSFDLVKIDKYIALMADSLTEKVCQVVHKQIVTPMADYASTKVLKSMSDIIGHKFQSDAKDLNVNEIVETSKNIVDGVNRLREIEEEIRQDEGEHSDDNDKQKEDV